MAMYCEPLVRKRFSGETLSEAKTKALKWYGRYAACKKEFSNTMCSLEDVSDGQSPIVALTVYVCLDQKEVQEKHCGVCKEFRGLFYVNNQSNCSRCDVTAFNRRVEEMLHIKKSYDREQLKRIIEEDER